jgi:NAD(P)-dependent dehydrogenase (short-subunit alcohol dehydrogenase family)
MTDISKPLAGRVALLTGASRGIGYHTAKALSTAGAHVIAGARTQGGLDDLDDEIRAAGGEATLVPLDLSDMAAIDRLGGVIHERWGKLDILVANAAMLGTISPIGHVDAKVFDRLMTLNVTSTWRLIRSLDPLLRLSDAGRAVVISSSVAHSARAYWAPYAASKAAVEVLARSWADETKNMPLRVNCVDPGATRTAMRAQAVPGEDPATLPHPSQVGATIASLTYPEIVETGKLYVVRAGKFVSYRTPE